MVASGGGAGGSCRLLWNCRVVQGDGELFEKHQKEAFEGRVDECPRCN